MDEPNALQDLDTVVREMLYVHAPVPATTRIAVQENIPTFEHPRPRQEWKILESIRFAAFR